MAFSCGRSKLFYLAILVACLGMFAALTAPVRAANPPTISFQGKVVNANGTNVTDGTYSFVFKLYTVSSGGSAIWTETDSLSVSAGVFQVSLGSSCPFFTANACNGSTPVDFNANPNLYLGITFNSDPAGEMSPRVQLQSVPFAYNADKVGGLSASQLVQLSPGSQQSGSVNVNGSGTFGGALNVTGLATLSGGGTLAGAFNLTYSSGVSGTAHGVNATNTNASSTAATVNGEDVTLTGHSNTNSGANTLNGVNFENVTAITNNTFNALNIGTGYNNGINFGSASGITNFINTPTAVLTSGGSWTGLTGVTLASGNLNLNGGGITNTGSLAGVTTITTTGAINGLGISSGALTGVAGITTSGGYTQSGSTANSFTGATSITNNLTVNTGTANQLLVSSGTSVPTVDQVAITNAGAGGVTAAGVNSLSLNYKGGAAAVEAGAERIDLQPGTTSGGTWNGLRVVPNATGAASGVTENGLKVDTLTTPGAGTENALFVGTGWDNLINLNGTPIINGSGVLQNAALSTGVSYTNLTQVGALSGGSIASGFGTITTSNTITGTQIIGSTGIYTTNGTLKERIDNTGNLLNIATITSNGNFTDTDTGENVLALTGAPVNTATVSMLQLGAAIAGGNAATNGGTYIGINEPSSGAGSVADFLNFETNGTSQFKVTSDGSVTGTGSLTGGVDSDIKAAETATASYTEAVAATGYYLSANTTTTNSSLTTTFNITGLPATDGTIAAITGTTIKGITSGSRAHTVIIEINGTIMATLATATQTGAATVARSFTVMRLNAVWQVIGEGPTATPASTTPTLNVADYAEWIDYAGQSAPGPGTILRAAPASETAEPSDGAYDPAVIGVVSTTPFQVGGADDGHSVVMALTGRVPVRVSLENGPIAAGDPLTASSTPGVAMKASKPGQIIGKALAAYDGDQPGGEVMMQLQVGYDDPSSGSTTASSSSNAVFSSDLAAGQGALQINGNQSGVNNVVTVDSSAAGELDLGTLGTTAVHISRPGQLTTIEGGLEVHEGAVFDGNVNLHFTGQQHLNLTSDLSGAENGISFVGSPSGVSGPHNGVLVQQAALKSGSNGLSDALKIDNANASLAIGNAIDITNSGGGGYGNLISSPNFSVNGTGGVAAASLGIKAGSGGTVFTVTDGSGSSVVTIDGAGNGSFHGGLNIASATVSGALTVGGDSTFEGLSTFQKLATFMGNVVFHGDAEFDGHLTVASDTAGYASLRTGESKVHVTFAKAYSSPPVVSLAIVNGQFVEASVNNVTAQGFDIELQSPAASATTLSWTAVTVKNPVTATNPQPTMSTASTSTATPKN